MTTTLQSDASTGLTNRVAVVTGGASGLGAGAAKALSEAGMQVVILDRDKELIERTSRELGVIGRCADVTSEPEIEAIFDDISRQLGCVSLLVNCAGVATPGSVVRRGEPMPLDEFQQVVEVNLLGTLNCIRCAVPQMINRYRTLPEGSEAGLIINVASIAAFEGQMGQAAYSASKGGIAGMVLPLARELGDYGIRVMAIAPGVFETPMTMNLPQKSRDVVFAAVPPFPKRAGNAADFAALVLFLTTNSMLNGEVIRLDGGLRMPARI